MSLILPFVPCHKWDPPVSPFFLLTCAPLCASLLVPPESGLSSFSLPGRLTPLPIWTPVASLAPCTGTSVIYEEYNLGEVTSLLQNSAVTFYPFGVHLACVAWSLRQLSGCTVCSSSGRIDPSHSWNTPGRVLLLCSFLPMGYCPPHSVFVCQLLRATQVSPQMSSQGGPSQTAHASVVLRHSVMWRVLVAFILSEIVSCIPLPFSALLPSPLERELF